ncbi:hypothetical protein V6N13_036881 [Hibiscus sabdariffa]
MELNVGYTIRPSRGLRQDDPLSPFLFLICSEGLSSLLCQAEVSGHLGGFQINRYTPILTLLLFVDDSLSYLWTGINQRSSCPKEYASSSGQIINFDKSGLFFSSNDAEKSHDDVELILGVDNTSNMEKYLGLPPMLGRDKKSFLSLRDKMKI